MPDPLECAAHLAKLRSASQASADLVRERCSGLTPAQLTWRPPEGGWGVADCLEHMTITDTRYLDNMDRVLAKQSRTDEPPPFQGGSWAAKFIRMLEPGSKRRFKAPGKFRSQDGEPPADALPRFLATQDRLQAMLATLEGYDLTHVKVASPVSRLIRFRLGDVARLMVIHDARHVAQAERVLTRPEFPPA